jgi:hypothetical protein
MIDDVNEFALKATGGPEALIGSQLRMPCGRDRVI